ncbi:dihydroorotase [Gulosibacter molinativorax]|uniref:Dihydroorotase n=1 Tax=Gulosibacter molinativorax TaxID=256821 RepID=A0ABT7C784_9MICO|nr:dihydroorotase [Gulosibacter molinativorax]MDJ1371065.1 dihydroorotase [Gulosibacter molinativorax]QUY61425.1 Dihydroorotase [Gulosibacter molinativorax]
MSTILIRGARPYGEEPSDILIDGERIAQIAAAGTLAAPEGAEVIDAEGLIALPGLVDLHVHLREPGFESSETVLTGSRAAAKGGFTTIFAMPNTSPVQDTAGVVETVWALGREAGYADVHPIGAVTVGQAGEHLAELGSMADSRAHVRMFSDDGHCVFDPLIMRRALEYVKAFDGVVAQHAQDPKLTIGAQMNEGSLSAELGLGGWPEVAETSIIARDALLAEQVDSRVHVCHLSTATAVDIVRFAKARGIKITAEVTPHHLLLTEEKVRGFDARFKVNPPLRTESDVMKLRAALADGTIDVVGTDHAPHPVDSKQKEWDHAAMGMVGLESALRIVHATMVNTGLLDWRGVARVMSETPAKIGSAAEAGRPLEAGELANVVLYDPEASSVFTEADLSGKSTNSPYLGLELPGSVEYTVYRGTPTLRAGVPAAEEEVARANRTRLAESEL